MSIGTLKSLGGYSDWSFVYSTISYRAFTLDVSLVAVFLSRIRYWSWGF